MLLEIGKHGAEKGNFSFPRGLAVEEHSGDIYIADTVNHRIQVFNSFGVLKQVVGIKGKGEGELNEPTSVALCPNSDIVVADKKNSRISIFSKRGKFKYYFNTIDAPYVLAVDAEFNIIVGTLQRTVEVYRRVGTLRHSFDLGPPKDQLCVIWLTLHTSKSEIIVSDPVHHLIKFYNYKGKLLYQFQPQCNGTGLACFNTGVCMDNAGQLLVADTLNHTVNVYSERGVLLRQVMGPTDEVGAIQSICLSPEGHIVGLEFTSNGTHCLKMFRYTVCECHRTKPSSSKKSALQDK